MKRRELLISSIGLIMSAAAARAQDHLHWTYEGTESPEHWGDLAPEFRVCSHGKEQSPIDITHAISANADDISINWDPAAEWKVVDTGHSVQANTDNGGTLEINGKTFKLLQFHFHSPSEHTIEGEHAPMELHFVHKADDDFLAVIGVMITGGGNNDLFDQVIGHAPHDDSPAELSDIGTADPIALVPDNRDHYIYQGSLTTPPCTESVTWVVMKTPIQVSDKSITAFRDIYEMNARPVQLVGRRYILAD